METYSYISENGTVREIADIVAREKNETQDARITDVETALNDVPQTIDTHIGNNILILPYDDTQAESAEALIRNKYNYARQNGFLNNNAKYCLIPGGWRGAQYGQTMLTALQNNSLVHVVFHGTNAIIQAVVRVSTGTVQDLSRFNAEKV